jgi:uncharacterized protein DUF4157
MTTQLIAARRHPRTAGPDSVLQRRCACGQNTTGGRSCNACERKTSVRTKLIVPADDSDHERAADKAAADAVHATPTIGRSAAIERLHIHGHSLATDDVAPAIDLPSHSGQPLSAGTRDFAERAFGEDFSRVRLHSGPVAERTAATLGARAFTHGDNIWLGRGASESDRLLISHELAHVVQGRPGVISLRRATYLERRAWLSFFSHPVPRRLLNNYMDDTGATVNLSKAEMIGCNPIVDLRRSPAFLGEVSSRSAGGSASIAVSGWGGALTNGTLGNFTINYAGTLNVTPAAGWTFSGAMNFYDYWDFDPKPFNSGSGRPASAEIKVRVAAAALPGRPFPVTSVTVPVSQSSADTQATWAGGTPTAVGGPAARSATDIEVGGAGGDVGGPAGADVGGETGAQSSEDLNR